MSRRRKVNPSMRGMSRSRQMQSGRSCRARRSPSSPSAALPTTSWPPAASVASTARRLASQSSTTSTRAELGPRTPARDGMVTGELMGRGSRVGARLAVDEVVAQVDQLEVGGDVEQGLGVTEQEEAAVAQLLVEAAHHALPRQQVE